jgi:RNA polymerase sigma factor (sigma-70 family)
MNTLVVMEDAELLKEYVCRNSEDAFRELVDRHVNFVYAAALRQVRSTELAKDVTQAVFMALAQKARSLSRDVILEGWLFRAIRFAAANALRNERRYQYRIQEASRMQVQAGEDGDQNVWDEVVPILNETMAKLGEKDRNAVLLRFFKQQSFKEVAQRLGTTEEGAKKRVTRALRTLAHLMAQRGVMVSAAVLAATITANGASPAPVGLAFSVASLAGGKGVVASSSVLTLTKGTSIFMAWSKSKAIVATSVILLVAGTGGGLAFKLSKRQNATDAQATNPLKTSNSRPGEAFFGAEDTRFDGLKLAGVRNGTRFWISPDEKDSEPPRGANKAEWETAQADLRNQAGKLFNVALPAIKQYRIDHNRVAPANIKDLQPYLAPYLADGEITHDDIVRWTTASNGRSASDLNSPDAILLETQTNKFGYGVKLLAKGAAVPFRASIR